MTYNELSTFCQLPTSDNKIANLEILFLTPLKEATFTLTQTAHHTHYDVIVMIITFKNSKTISNFIHVYHKPYAVLSRLTPVTVVDGAWVGGAENTLFSSSLQ